MIIHLILHDVNTGDLNNGPLSKLELLDTQVFVRGPFSGSSPVGDFLVWNSYRRLEININMDL